MKSVYFLGSQENRDNNISEFPTVATYPLAGGRREGSRVRLPWLEDA